MPTGWRAMESEVRILFPSRVSQTGKWPLSDGHSSCRAALPTSTSVPDSGVYPSPSCVRPWGMKSLPLPNPPSLLAQGPALSLIASLCPTRLFVNSPFIKFPSNYHNWRVCPLFPAGISTDKGHRCRFLCHTTKLTGSRGTDF